MPCHIWSRQMASPLCGSFRVSSNHTSGWTPCSIGSRQMISLLRPSRLPQTFNWEGFNFLLFISKDFVQMLIFSFTNMFVCLLVLHLVALSRLMLAFYIINIFKTVYCQQHKQEKEEQEINWYLLTTPEVFGKLFLCLFVAKDFFLRFSKKHFLQKLKLSEIFKLNCH